MGKSKARAMRMPKPRAERRKYVDKGSRAGGVGKLSAKKAAKAARNRRGEDLGTEKAITLQRDGSGRKEQLTRAMRLKAAARAVDRLRGELSAHREPLPNAAELAAAFKERKAERLFGAARPWDSRDKSTHGCGYDIYDCMDHCGDWENQPPAEDLLAQQHGSLWQNALCRPYCHALLELGAAQLAAGQGEAAAATLTGLMEAEPTDPLGARAYLLSAYMDEGMLGEARALVEAAPPTGSGGRPPGELYSLALIEYIASEVLQEEGASQAAADAALRAAMAANPYPAAFICWAEAFQQVVNPDEDAEPLGEGVGSTSGSTEGRQLTSALQYCIRDIAVWGDADGAIEWVANSISEHEEALMWPFSEDAEAEKSAQLYRAVYQMDVEMRMEGKEEEEEEEGESDDSGGDGS